jgi:cobalt-zinc-cadmium efflux system protein
VLMTRACVGLLGDAGRIFLEAAPRGIDPDDVGNTLARAPGVVSVHDLHVWELTTDFPSLSAHVVVGRAEDCHAARARLEQLLRDDFAIDHTTLQVDHADAESGAFIPSAEAVGGDPHCADPHGAHYRAAPPTG